MKIKNTLLVGLMAVAGLSSCVSEELKSELEKKGSGIMTLDVSLLKPEKVTRAETEVFDFPVDVVSEDETYNVHYNAVSDVPTAVTLPVGNYTVSSHSNLELEKRMSQPYYMGEKPMEITNGGNTQVKVLCKMKNSRIEVNYSDEFFDAFASWTITIDDSDETGLYFTNTSETNEWYWLFEGEQEELKLNFTGVLKSDGSTVKYEETLKKTSAAMEQYGDDAKYFHGGDAIVINIAPEAEEPESGKITSILINANVTFVEDNGTVTFELTDAENTQGGGGVEPGNDDLITLTIPAPVTLSADESATADPSSGDVVMHAENGLKSIVVNVVSSSDEMMEQLAAVAEGYEGVDLVNGCEVVENQNLVEFLAGLDRQITVPTEGDTDYTFPVGQFYLFLGILPGTHNFVMTVTDMEGNKKSGTVQVTITE